MPRHFLVKRHRYGGGALLRGVCLQNGDDRSDSNVYSTTIIDTDKQMIIRDTDYNYDYSSPDSGYAVSPSSIYIGLTREKENLATDRDNNNSSNCNTSIDVVQPCYISDSLFSKTCTNISNNFSNTSKIPTSQLLEPLDSPLDLSASCGKKTTLQIENHNQHQNDYQQQQIYHCLSSSDVVATELIDNKVAQNHNANSELFCYQTFPSNSPLNLSSIRKCQLPDTRLKSLTPELKTTNSSVKQETNFQSEYPSHVQSISVPTTLQWSNSSISCVPSSPRAIVSSQSITDTVQLKTLSPLLRSPRRKRMISDDSNETLPQDLSKKLPALSTKDIIDDLTTTPCSKDKLTQKVRTTEPVHKKSHDTTLSHVATSNGKKLKAVRRLNFDIDTTSPVSGTIIKDIADFHADEGKVVYGDIEPSLNVVEVTQEARSELDKIENRIGDYICQLCKEFYDDAFQLAQHRCTRIVYVEYRCPDCEKMFNCPANLASHRRWHKPRDNEKLKADTKHGNLLAVESTHINEDIQTRKHVSPFIMPIKSTLTGNNDVVSRDITESKQPLSENNTYSGENAFTYHEIHRSDYSEDFSKFSRFNSLNESSSQDQEKNISGLAIPTQLRKLSSNTDQEISSESIVPCTTSSEQDSNLRPNSVIAPNSLHLKSNSFTSSLTSEERSLVMQVINSHNYQHETQSVPSTTVGMPPLISDNHCTITNTSSTNVNYTSSTSYNETGTNNNDSSRTSSAIKRSSPQTVQSVNSPTLSSLHLPEDLTETINIKKTTQSIRQEQRWNECSFCGKRFQRESYLRKHITFQHSKHKFGSMITKRSNSDNKSAYICSIFDLNTSSYDDNGINTNTSCGECGKAFTNESARIKHETTAHRHIGNLVCSRCGLNFSSKTMLDKHERSAHTVDIYTCKYCPSTFHSSPGLTRHINKYHPTENTRVILLQMPTARTY